MSDQTARLSKLAGFDVAKKPKVTDDIMKEVMGEIQEQREEKAKEKARGLITKALELHEEMVKAESEFKRQKAKFEKELGKVLNQLENDLRQASGQAPVEEEPEEATE